MAERLLLITDPSITAPNPDPLVQASINRHTQGVDSHVTLMVGHVRGDRALNKTLGLDIIHASKAPIYNLTLTRPETLAPWLEYCNVNFFGTPLPMIHPAGIQKFGLPSLGALPELELPSIGLPSIPFPNFSFPLANFLQYLINLAAFWIAQGIALGAMVLNFLNAILQDLIEKIKGALPDLSRSVPIEWFINLLWKLGPINLIATLPQLIAVPPFVWPILGALPSSDLLNLNLPTIPGVDMGSLGSLLSNILSAFGEVTKPFLILIRWLGGLGEALAGILAAMLTNLSINISFPFPGIDFGQFPPAGTPWPAPPPGQTAVVPLVQWANWMKAPLIANIPGPLPPGLSMAAATVGTFAMTSMPGYMYASNFDLRVVSGLAPGIYTQEFYLEGTHSAAGGPLQKMAKINLVAQVLENTMTPGLRPMGLLTY